MIGGIISTLYYDSFMFEANIFYEWDGLHIPTVTKWFTYIYCLKMVYINLKYNYEMANWL